VPRLPPPLLLGGQRPCLATGRFLSKVTAAPALWTKHRPIAIAIAREYYFPGADDNDVRQEALIGLWYAVKDFDPERGLSFPNFARLVIHRRLTGCLKMALRPGRMALSDAGRELDGIPSRDEQESRERLWEMVEASKLLTIKERSAVEAYVAGTYTSRDRKMENALQSARRKLRG